MSDISVEIGIIAIVWLFVIVATSRMTARSDHGSVGLPMAYLFASSFLYIGAFSYAVPGYSHIRLGGNRYLASYVFTEQTVLLGALATTIGFIGFMIGCWLVSPRSNRRTAAELQMPTSIDIGPGERNRLLWVLGLLGISGFVLNGADLPIPMLQAISQVNRNVAVVAICLGAAFVVLVDRRRNYVAWVLAGAAIPVAYVIVWGFVSYGFIVLTCLLGFWLAVLASPRLGMLRIAVAGTIGVYILLSAFVAWMSFREELREILWADSSGVTERASAIIGAFAKTEWLRPSNFESLDWLNTRLNQYVFVGKAIEYHELVGGLKLYGESIFLAPLALVPRFLWPDKPEMGGSTLVATHTGMRFSESTTFGAGPVFEFFVNFGWVGIFLGFVVLGLIVRLIDRKASVALRKAQFLDFARWFTAGLAFVAPLTDFFFMFNTAILSFLFLTALKHVLGRGSVSSTGRHSQATSGAHIARSRHR
jgi:hypothetical protein